MSLFLFTPHSSVAVSLFPKVCLLWMHLSLYLPSSVSLSVPFCLCVPLFLCLPGSVLSLCHSPCLLPSISIFLSFSLSVCLSGSLTLGKTMIPPRHPHPWPDSTPVEGAGDPWASFQGLLHLGGSTDRQDRDRPWLCPGLSKGAQLGYAGASRCLKMFVHLWSVRVSLCGVV